MPVRAPAIRRVVDKGPGGEVVDHLRPELLDRDIFWHIQLAGLSARQLHPSESAMRTKEIVAGRSDSFPGNRIVGSTNFYLEKFTIWKDVLFKFSFW